jgi:hypothetical protein
MVVSCAVFFIVWLQYFLATPILEGQDVAGHYQYIRILAREHRFPGGRDTRLTGPETAQYPLYYLVSAAASELVPTDDFDDVAIGNPHAGDTRPGFPCKTFFHRPFVGFPHGTELSVRIVEVVSLLCGLGTVACAVLTARLLLPASQGSWLFGGLVPSVIPAFDSLFASVTNDVMVTLLASVTILLLMHGLRSPAQ